MGTLPFLCSSQPLAAEEFAAVMDELKTDAAAVWSLLQVESGKAGYLADRRPQILFERAIFHKQTKGAYDGAHPGVSAGSWGGYTGGAAEYGRLAEAHALDPNAALQSASWGIAQIMGFNFAAAGFGSVSEFVRAMCTSEGAQLRAFAQFLKNKGIAAALVAHDWERAARLYNGPAQVADYAARLGANYAKLKTPASLPDLQVRAAQLLLTFLARQLGNAALDPGAIDGLAGGRTLGAVNAFLAARGEAAARGIDAGVVEALKAALAPGMNLALA